MADTPQKTNDPQNITLNAGTEGIVDISGQNTTVSVGYVDAQGDEITDGDDRIVITEGTSLAKVDAGDGDDHIEDETNGAYNEVAGGAGSDTIYTNSTGPTFAGGQAWNTILDATVDDEDDHNLLVGGNGNNWFYGDGGHDVMEGGGGSDIIAGYGKSGSTEIYGGSGSDRIIGDGQNSPNTASFFANNPNPTLLDAMAFHGNGQVAQGAILVGGSGDDLVIGTGGNDTINGGGNNSRSGPLGPEGEIDESDNDLLYGGGGADTFIWQGEDRGNDIIADFGNGNAAGAVGNGDATDNDFVDLSHIFNADTLQAYRDLVGDQSIATPLDALNHHLTRPNAVQTQSFTGGRGDQGDFTGTLITFNGTDFTGPTLLLGGHTGALTHDQTNVQGPPPDGIVHVTNPGTSPFTANVGYTDAQGDRISNNNDHIVLDNTVGRGGGAAYIFAGDGDDLIHAEDAHRASIIGGGGSDTIYGPAGAGVRNINEILTGGTGWVQKAVHTLEDDENDHNIVYAGNGTNSIIGEGGHDTIYGGSGVDVIMGYGRSGSTTIDAGAGDDLIVADGQNSYLLTLSSVQQGQEIPLSALDPYLSGTVARGAFVNGGSGNDNIFGSGGNDTINGGNGIGTESDNDFLVGGDGADTFIWSGTNRGTDVIADFGRGNAAGALGNGIQTDNDFVDLSAYFNETTLAAYNATYGTSFSRPIDALNHNLGLPENQITDHRTEYFPSALTDGDPSGVHFSTSGRAISFNGADGSGPKLIFANLTRDLLPEETNVLCFMEGTQIKTATGQVAIERLKAGDMLLTAQGETEVLWLGRKTVSLSHLRERDYPVCIEAGALGAGLPYQDLYVTADHGMIVGGYVVNASALVNGKTIRYVSHADLPEVITYYHIETRQHDEIYANGALSETFIDYVGRSAFDNYAEYLNSVGADRIIPEMSRTRISSQRKLPDSLRRVLNIEDNITEEFEKLMLLLNAS